MALVKDEDKLDQKGCTHRVDEGLLAAIMVWDPANIHALYSIRQQVHTNHGLDGNIDICALYPVQLLIPVPEIPDKALVNCVIDVLVLSGLLTHVI